VTAYDKGKYHDDTVAELGLPEAHADHHTAFFLRWLVERALLSAAFEDECAELLGAHRAGAASACDVYAWCDRVLADDMLSDEGNAFARDYFDFDCGAYLADYARVLQRDLPSQYHVPFTDENYRALRDVIDARHAEWRARPPAPPAAPAPAGGVWARVRGLFG
jgi:hypothetical protein